MADVKRNRFTKYFSLLLDALRSKAVTPMRPAEAIAWIRERVDVSPDNLTRTIENGRQSIFENDVHWARFYLVKAGLISKAKRGFWSLTPEGRQTQLTPEETWALYTRVRDAALTGSLKDEEELPAPEAADDDQEERSFWFVGAAWGTLGDQTSRFLAENIWENGYDDQYFDLVRRMKPGDRIAIKSSFVRRHGLPFDVGGKPVSTMRIKQTGTILENLDDGQKIRVAWDPSVQPRDWYFYTYRKTILQVDIESEDGRRLVDFAFRGAPQDYAWWLAQPYWVEKYGVKPEIALANPAVVSFESVSDDIEDTEEPSYTLDDIIADGCFLTHEELEIILRGWRQKKNLVLQGPPGTGKTWLAKRLGFALVGSNDREAARSRLRVIQFHPSLAYEDFVRGWRPSGDGKLSLVDGIMMRAIEAAASEPDRAFVLVIEEINRGNPAQIFGEMLTLLEDTKRQREEAMELAYPRGAGERVYVPNNLYVIGTMNVADRSLAIVDLALRRRFAFVDLKPRLGPEWREWCRSRGLDDAMCSLIKMRIEALNAEITAATSLGSHFRIGHSFVTPDRDEKIESARDWFQEKVATEIGPLLDEYWYESLETANTARTKLLEGL